MTNQEHIAKIAAKIATIRRNKDGAVNGNAAHGHYQSLKHTMKANGMAHDQACREAAKAITTLLLRHIWCKIGQRRGDQHE